MVRRPHDSNNNICILSFLEFTDVACYSGVECEAEPVQVASIQTCCQDLSALKSYKTVGHVDTCNPCLGMLLLCFFCLTIIHLCSNRVSKHTLPIARKKQFLWGFSWSVDSISLAQAVSQRPCSQHIRHCYRFILIYSYTLCLTIICFRW